MAFRRLEKNMFRGENFDRFADKTPRGTGILEKCSKRNSSIQLQTPILLKVDSILQKMISSFAENILS